MTEYNECNGLFLSQKVQILAYNIKKASETISSLKPSHNTRFDRGTQCPSQFIYHFSIDTSKG